MQTLQVNDLRAYKIKYATFSGYYIYVNTNVQEGFQICISVPSRKSITGAPRWPFLCTLNWIQNNLGVLSEEVLSILAAFLVIKFFL